MVCVYIYIYTYIRFQMVNAGILPSIVESRMEKKMEN